MGGMAWAGVNEEETGQDGSRTKAGSGQYQCQKNCLYIIILLTLVCLPRSTRSCICLGAHSPQDAELASAGYLHVCGGGDGDGQ